MAGLSGCAPTGKTCSAMLLNLALQGFKAKFGNLAREFAAQDTAGV